MSEQNPLAPPSEDTETWCAEHADARTNCGCIHGENPDKAHRGQARIAYRLAAEHAGRLMHVHGIGWMRWDGTRWTEDNRGQARRAVLRTLRKALSDSLSDQDLRADVRKCESAAGLNGVLEIASALDPLAATVEDLDQDPYLLNCANGTVDLHTMQVHPHNPANRITKVTKAAFDPARQSEVWQKFLSSSLPNSEVRSFLQRYVGMALAGTVFDHVLAILTGEGRNGKGVFYGAVSHALGDYASAAEPDLFMHRDGGHPTGEMDLLGVRWVVISESDKGRKLAEATVKRLTGGDEIRARRMRQDFVSFQPSHTAALVTNYLPKVSGDDSALWARLRVVPFDVVIPAEQRDRKLPEKLQLEADAVLTWALIGWTHYQAEGLAEPGAVLDATNEYQSESDTVGRFIADKCATGPAFSALFKQLYSEFESWAASGNSEPMTNRAFGDALTAAGYERTTGTGNVALRAGIALQVEGNQS